MNKKQSILLILLVFILQFRSYTFAQVQNIDFWTFIEKTNDGSKYNLNFSGLENKLQGAPHVSERKPSEVILVMPTSYGGKITFKFYENTVIHSNLEKKYPYIKTFVGIGVENPSYRSTIVLNNGRIIGSIESYKDPSHFKSYSENDRNNGILVYSEKFLNQNTICKTNSSLTEQTREFPECIGSDDPCYPSGTELVTYRFAAMVTEAVNNEAADGTVDGGLTWLVGSVAYVNALYVRDVAFQLQIIENNDELIFTDSNPAPEAFKQDCGGGWADIGCELGVVDSVLDARIGSGGWDSGDEERVWDYGAVFDTGYPGGLAYCPGPTSAQVPSMWVFSHEVMHNFGSPHNYCAEDGIRTSIGGTIMAHRVNETPNMFSTHSTEWALNYQETVGPYGNWWYHNGSNQEITSNIIPELILPSENITIPAGTPYVLEGSSDLLNENYTYNWESNDTADEQYSSDPDAETFLLPTQGSLSAPVTPHSQGFRRVFPDMNVLLDNEYEKYGIDIYTGVNQIVEKLPFATREMNMRLVVRTNDPYAGSLNHKNLKFFVDGTAGPFRVTSQMDSTLWFVGSEETITWDIANTNNLDGVNCQSVDIALSINGDENFDYIIAESIPNIGSFTFTVPPTIPTNSARLMVRANDNIFFDINNGKINIQNGNIPSMTLSDDVLELTLPRDSLSIISFGVTNNGEEASVLSYNTHVAENLQINVGFDDSLLPDGWTLSTNAECDNPGWFITDDVSSSYFDVPLGDGYYIATNDDVCNGDGSNDIFFTGPIQLPNAFINLSFSRFFTGNYGQKLHVSVSTDGWENSTEVLLLDVWDGNNEQWLQEIINLDSYSGQVIDIAFRSNDDGNWASGVALDNIRLSVTPKWLSTTDSGYVHYLETSPINISVNTNNLEFGYYESKILVENIITGQKDSVKVELSVEEVNVSIDQSNIPSIFSLTQNYPNPFNPNTQIGYALPKEEYVTLLIFDLLGREVITLVDEVQSPGYRTINWNGMDNLGNNSGAGMYFYHLTAGHFSHTKKMVLLK